MFDSTLNLLEGSEQFWLSRLQIANWGAFSGIHDVPMAAKGHLFVGGSGSGKSTILDAIAVLLTPGRINFNAAARPGERRSDRSFMSYIRGAWSSEQDSDGRAATRFLRKESTWSAVAATFKSNLQQTVTLMFIGYVRGASREESSVVRNYFVIPQDFDLLEISDFSASDFNVRLIKKRCPESRLFPTFGPYFECFSRYFGISDQKVLHLLHKAQSAKNMGNIDAFFREFMLDTPGTFGIAQTLVEEFSELNQAYEIVKKTREQVQVLGQAKVAQECRAEAIRNVADYETLAVLTVPWKYVRLQGFLDEQVPQAELRLKNCRTELEATVRRKRDNDTKLDRLRAEHAQNGGDVLMRLEQERSHKIELLHTVQKRRMHLEETFARIDLSIPQKASDFNALLQKLQGERDELAESTAEIEDKIVTLKIESAQKQETFKTLRHEIEAMLKQPSNIPSKKLELRGRLAEELGLTAQDLPFAGELMQILPGEERWQGACERVLRPLAISLLVSDKHYARFAKLVNELNLGDRLVYNRTVRRGDNPAWSENSVPSKFEIQNGPWTAWLCDELAARFDYVCVEDTSRFAKFDKAVTIAGQIKHTVSRHEKDDRRKVGDPSSWVTGFSNVEKRRHFEKQAGELAVQIEALGKKERQFGEKLRVARDRFNVIQNISSYSWEEVDTSTIAEALNRIEKEITERQRSNNVLQELAARIDQAIEERDKLEERIGKLNKHIGQLEDRLNRLKIQRDEAVQALQGVDVPSERLGELDRLDREREKTPLTSENAEARSHLLERHLKDAASKEHLKQIKHEETMRSAFHDFKIRWPTDADAMDETLESAEDYFLLLDQLETDGLPKYEERFRDLLENHAKQNLIDLVNELDAERHQIKDRMKEVNASLAEVAFNRSEAGDTHLRIAVSDRRLPEVVEFKQMQSEIMRDSFEAKSQVQAEKYFKKLAGLVEKLNPDNSQEHIWRERVLDVRGHVTFQGIEFDNAGETIEVLASGAGKSGGQQQKLTMTCLVAALRYQLGGTRAQKPKFAPVMMDEAFDKADSEFTDISMRIFKDFGFQPIIATPEKGLYTLEPYMGSFSYVSCRERKASSVINLQPEELGQALHGDENQTSSGALV